MAALPALHGANTAGFGAAAQRDHSKLRIAWYLFIGKQHLKTKKNPTTTSECGCGEVHPQHHQHHPKVFSTNLKLSIL